MIDCLALSARGLQANNTYVYSLTVSCICGTNQKIFSSKSRKFHYNFIICTYICMEYILYVYTSVRSVTVKSVCTYVI